METVILALHYFVCIFLIVVILLQAGKGADIGAAFGGASQTVFGSRGAATFLSKLTTAVAIIFLVTSISLAGISRNRGKSSIVKNVGGPSQALGTPNPTASPAAVLESKTPPATSKPLASPRPIGTPRPK